VPDKSSQVIFLQRVSIAGDSRYIKQKQSFLIETITAAAGSSILYTPASYDLSSNALGGNCLNVLYWKCPPEIIARSACTAGYYAAIRSTAVWFRGHVPSNEETMQKHFSRSYCHAVWSATGICLSVCFSVTQCMWLNDTSYIKSVWQGNRKCPPKGIGQLSTPHSDPIPSYSPPAKFRNFTSLLYIVLLITWTFCSCWYELRKSFGDGKVLLWRWYIQRTYDRLLLSNSWASCSKAIITVTGYACTIGALPCCAYRPTFAWLWKIIITVFINEMMLTRYL